MVSTGGANTRRRWLMPIVYTGVTMVLFWRLWTPIDGARATWKYDPQHEYWGDLEFQRQTLATGDLALWNPYDRGGFPLHGDPQPGLLYPGNWPIVAVGLLRGGVDYVLVELKIIAHWIFAAIGLHLFIRRRGGPEPACYLGGLLMCVVCPALRVTGSALNWSWAWFPWGLLAIEYYAARPHWTRAAILGSVCAMPLLAGAPAMSWYFLLFIAPFFFWRLRGMWRRHLTTMALAVVVAGCWLAPLVASNLELIPHTERAVTDLKFVADRGIEPRQLLNLLLPPLSGGEPITLGLLPLLAWATLLLRRGGHSVPARQLAPVAIVFFVSAGIGLLFAMGDFSHVLPAAASVMPPMRLFRYAYRYSYIATAACAVGGALGLAYLLQVEGKESRAVARRVTAVGFAIAAVLGAAWLIVVAANVAGAHRANALAIGCLGSAAAAFILRAVVLRRGAARQRWGYVAAGVAALVVWMGNSKVQAVGFGPRPSTPNDSIVERLDGVGDHRYRIFDADYLTYRPGTRLGIRDFRGYEEDPLRTERYANYLSRSRRRPRLLGHANVRYYLEGKTTKIRVPTRGMKRVERGVFEVREVAPAVYYVAQPEAVAGLEEALARLASIEPGAGAVVEGDVRHRGAVGSPPAAGVIRELAADRLIVDIETPGPGLIVVNEAYFPGWSARINGDATDVVPVNGMFRGIWVSAAGPQRIEMEFRPLRFYGLLPAYLAALLVAVLALVRGTWPSNLSRASAAG